jgi:hypothetical protein
LAVTWNQLSLAFQDIQEAVTNPSDTGGTTANTYPDSSTAALHGYKYHYQYCPIGTVKSWTPHSSPN